MGDGYVYLLSAQVSEISENTDDSDTDSVYSTASSNLDSLPLVRNQAKPIVSTL